MLLVKKFKFKVFASFYENTYKFRKPLLKPSSVRLFGLYDTHLWLLTIVPKGKPPVILKIVPTGANDMYIFADFSFIQLGLYTEEYRPVAGKEACTEFLMWLSE